MNGTVFGPMVDRLLILHSRCLERTFLLPEKHTNPLWSSEELTDSTKDFEL